MDTESALSIIESRNEIEVLYQDSPVWIQSVNGDIARIRDLKTGDEREVLVRDLIRPDYKGH
ncbi:MAG: H-type small acid-soluble spore protein [Clostridia bacterium]|nr:H-type small acid-soluble spore protein [Clostridia bacterium]